MPSYHHFVFWCIKVKVRRACSIARLQCTQATSIAQRLVGTPRKWNLLCPWSEARTAVEGILTVKERNEGNFPSMEILIRGYGPLRRLSWNQLRLWSMFGRKLIEAISGYPKCEWLFMHQDRSIWLDVQRLFICIVACWHVNNEAVGK